MIGYKRTSYFKTRFRGFNSNSKPNHNLNLLSMY